MKTKLLLTATICASLTGCGQISQVIKNAHYGQSQTHQESKPIVRKYNKLVDGKTYQDLVSVPLKPTGKTYSWTGTLVNKIGDQYIVDVFANSDVQNNTAGYQKSMFIEYNKGDYMYLDRHQFSFTTKDDSNLRLNQQITVKGKMTEINVFSTVIGSKVYMPTLTNAIITICE